MQYIFFIMWGKYVIYQIWPDKSKYRMMLHLKSHERDQQVSKVWGDWSQHSD